MPLPSLEHDIPGSYQLDALLRGRALQRAWHRARLDLAGWAEVDIFAHV